MNTLSIIFVSIACLTTIDLLSDGSLPVNSSSSGDMLQYDDGTAVWSYFEQQYRGIWFNLDDFIPGEPGFDLVYTELWFYHDTAHPWDTSETHVEFWNGTSSNPQEFLDQVTVTALHFAPSIIEHPLNSITVESQFWIIQNTDLSLGGWPSIIGDHGGLPVVHSMVRENMSLWEPYTPANETNGNFFIRTLYDPWPWSSLAPQTWASIKTVF